MKLFVFSILLLCFSLSYNCSFAQKTTKPKKPKAVKTKPCLSLKQGIKGTIIFKSGNLMPSVEVDNDSKNTTKASNKGVKREVFIYALTNRNQVESSDDETFFSKPKTKLIARTFSNQEGCFSIRLAEGKYSVFVKEKGKLYANSFDGDGNIFPISVKEGFCTDIVFEINYAAVY